MPRGIAFYVAVALSILLCFVSLEVFQILSPPKVPQVDENIWWGPGEPVEVDSSIREFRINISEKDIADLKWRLQNHKPLVPPLEGLTHEYGVNTKFLKEFIDFWAYEYNWTERQSFLNSVPQFKTNIQGLDIHFLHLKPSKSEDKKVLPLLMVHGWPMSVRDFYEALKILTTNTNRGFSLEIIVPALPGFGFSQAASKPGLDLVQTVVVFKKLMTRLGFERFYVQGGDLGGVVVQSMSVLYPEAILGLHTNSPFVFTIKSFIKPLLASIYSGWYIKPEHYDRLFPLAKRALFLFQESGYMHLQITKPDTIGAAINDSPIGLASYIIEKFITGSNFSWIYDFDSKKLQEKFPYTHIIDTLMYYWLTNSATSSFRMYRESLGDLYWSQTNVVMRIPVQVPTIILRAHYDIYMADGVLGETYPNLLDLNDYDVGHFPALEAPEIFAKDVLNAIEKFENYHLKNKHGI